MNTLTDLTHAEARRHAAANRLFDAAARIVAAVENGSDPLTPELVAEYNAARAELLAIEAING
jgi:hypothetical protein